MSQDGSSPGCTAGAGARRHAAALPDAGLSLAATARHPPPPPMSSRTDVRDLSLHARPDPQPAIRRDSSRSFGMTTRKERRPCMRTQDTRLPRFRLHDRASPAHVNDPNLSLRLARNRSASATTPMSSRTTVRDPSLHARPDPQPAIRRDSSRSFGMTTREEHRPMHADSGHAPPAFPPT